MTVRAYNPTGSPVAIDVKGHTLPGREWGDVDPDDAVGRAALAPSGQLLGENTNQQPPDASPPDSPASTPTPRASRRASSKE